MANSGDAMVEDPTLDIMALQLLDAAAQISL
jgi:hypothetical protein